MKLKRISAITGLSLAALLALGVAVLFITNLSDTELRPDVSAKLSSAILASPEEEKASLLISELKVPSDREPKICSSRDWCARSEISKPEFTDYLEKYKAPLAVYNELVKLPYYFVDPKALGRGVFNFLKFTMLQRREWNLRLAKSGGAAATKSVAEEMRNLNRFLMASLAHPQSIIEAQVFLLVLKGNRNFLVEAARAEPTLRAAFEKPDCQSLTGGFSDLDFTKIAAAVHEGELRGVAVVLQQDPTFDELGMSDINDASNFEPGFSKRVLNQLVKAGFLRNDTLNRLSELLEQSIAKVASPDAVESESEPRRLVSLSPRNVIGRNIVLVFGSQFDANFYRMKETIATLRKAVSFESKPI